MKGWLFMESILGKILLNIKKYVAELFGTFVLVFVACGAAMTGMDAAGVALAFGLVIVAMAFTIGNISGCHINPAVSLAMLIDGQLSLFDFIGYVVSQFLGAILGAGALALTVSESEVLAGCSNHYIGYDEEFIFGSFLVEIILTFLFVFVIMRVTKLEATKKYAGLFIGAALTLVHLVGIGFTGTSVNPARSFGPAIFAGDMALEQVWVFLIAPFIGAAIAAIVAKFLNKKEEA